MSKDDSERPLYSAIYRPPRRSTTIPTTIIGLGLVLCALYAVRRRARRKTGPSLSSPIREASSSLVDSATKALRQRAEATTGRALASLGSPITESSSSLVDSATEVLRQRAEAKKLEFIETAQAQVASGAEKLSNEIERRLENVIEGAPGGIQVRPLIASAVQIALAATLENLFHKRSYR